MSVIQFSGVTKQYGNQILYKNASFMIRPGDKIGLVGPNGAGKTTIFRLLTKEEGMDSGSIAIPEGTRLAYFSQTIGEMKGRSALSEVCLGNASLEHIQTELKIMEKKLEDSGINPLSDDEMEKLLERFGDYQADFERLGGYDIESRAQEILTGLGIEPSEHARDVGTFSGGQKMRIALAKILAMNPDVILMDEPTNYLDLESILWLETWLKDFKGGIVMTSHDRDFMNSIVNRIVDVSGGTLTTYTGNYDFFEREKEIRKGQQQAQFERQQDMLAKEEEFIARFAARASHAAQVQSRVKKLEKIDRVEAPVEDIVIDFEFPVPPRSSNDVVKVQNLGKSWPKLEGGEKLIFKNLNTTVRRLEKIAVVGVNGAGKSTLLKLICDLTTPTEGKVELGPNVKLGYFSQYALDVLNPKKTVLEEVSDQLKDATQSYVRNLLGAFLFRGDDVEKRISLLSGGEKSRVVLACLFATRCNLLVLDEPTNHLDIKSREVLQKALQKFEGTVLLVSHDRHFVRSIVNKVIEVDQGEVRLFPGDYDYYLEKKKNG